MYNKTIIRFDFCDILNNQGSIISLGHLTLDLDYSGYHKNLIQQLFVNISVFFIRYFVLYRFYLKSQKRELNSGINRLHD